MGKLRFFVPLVVLLLAVLMLSCGMTNPANGLLKSITVTPATADAKNFPNGQVQFTATATYIGKAPVTPATALWTPGIPWALDPQNAWPALSMSSQGLVSCGTAPPATYTIFATAPVDPHIQISQMTMNTPQLFATAQLTCP